MGETQRKYWWTRRPLAAAGVLLAILTLHAVRMVPEASNSPDWHDGVALVQGPRALPARFLGGLARMAPHTQLIVDAPPRAESVVVRGRLTDTEPASSIRFALQGADGRGTSVLLPVDPETAELAATLQWGPLDRIEGTAYAEGRLYGGDALEVGLSADGSVRLGGERLAITGPPVEQPARLVIAPTTTGVELAGVDWFDGSGSLVQARTFEASSPLNRRAHSGTVVRIVVAAVLLALLAIGVARLRGRLGGARDALTPMFPIVTLLLIPGILKPTLHPVVVGLDLAAAGFFAAWWVRSVRPAAVEPSRRWLPAAVFAATWGATAVVGLFAVGGDGGSPVGGEAKLHLDVGARSEHPASLVHQRADFQVTAEPGAVVELQLRYSDIRWRRPPLSVVLSFDEFLDSAILRDGLPIATGRTLHDQADWRVPVLVTVSGSHIEVFADSERILSSNAAPPRRGALAIQAVAGEADVELFSYQRAPRRGLGTVGLLLRPVRVAAGGWFAASLAALLLGMLVGGPRRLEVESTMRHALLVPVWAAGLLEGAIVADMLSSTPVLPLTPAGLHGLLLLSLGSVSAGVGTWVAVGAAEGARSRLIAAVAAPLIALVGLDGIGRFTDAPRLWEPGWLQYAGETGHAWWFSPGGVPFSDNLVEDNAFRGRRVPLHRALGERRIAIFGGSQAWGFGTQAPPDVYPAQLERLLGSDTTVLNAGVNAGTSFNARMMLRGRVLAFEPELAVFVFGANDNRFFWGDADEWDEGARARRAPGSRILSGSPLASTLAGGSRVLTGLGAMRRRGLSELDQTIAMTKNLVAAIDACRRLSIEVLLVAEPTWNILNERQLVEAAEIETDDPLGSEFHKALRRLGEEVGAPFATVGDRMADRQPEPLFTDTIHFSTAGHLAMAEALRDILYEEGLAGPAEPGPEVEGPEKPTANE